MEPTTIFQDLENISRVSTMELALENHHYLALKPIYKWMQTTAYNAARGKMLDFGCGAMPYRDMFLDVVEEYIGADVAIAAGATPDLIIRPNEAIPVADNIFDTVLSTQTLEHVPDFVFYLNECSRVLKPKGVLILTAPMQWRHHEEPHDYWRFTAYGLRYALDKAGFVVKSMAPCGGAFSLAGQIILNNMVEKRGFNNKVIIKTINQAALWLDEKYPDVGETMNWMCLAEKKL